MSENLDAPHEGPTSSRPLARLLSSDKRSHALCVRSTTLASAKRGDIMRKLIVVAESEV